MHSTKVGENKNISQPLQVKTIHPSLSPSHHSSLHPSVHLLLLQFISTQSSRLVQREMGSPGVHASKFQLEPSVHTNLPDWEKEGERERWREGKRRKRNRARGGDSSYWVEMEDKSMKELELEILKGSLITYSHRLVGSIHNNICSRWIQYVSPTRQRAWVWERVSRRFTTGSLSLYRRFRVWWKLEDSIRDVPLCSADGRTARDGGRERRKNEK